ncbi:MAG: hypothetical protein JW384_01033 [Nitrosomonadaceae bacterium]|nr:hypothetical protein [Nitrosomonadaceae bacterium]
MQNVREERETVSVRDLNQGAYLLICQYELLGVSWSGHVAWWKFRNHDGNLEDYLRTFVNGKTVGNINQFVNAQRILKQTLSENY